MAISADDLQLQFDPGSNRLKVFNPVGALVFTCECRNRTTANGQLGHDGNIPPGSFILGAPVPKDTVPFGAWFIPISDETTNGPMHEHGRSGIGIHGGGSGLPQPLAPNQSPPWVPTHGCLRVLNADLAILVKHVHTAQKKGKCFLTVLSRQPGAEADYTLGDYAPLAELDPDE